MQYDKSLMAKIVELGVHPFVLLRQVRDEGGKSGFLVCPTQNEIARFVAELRALPEFRKSHLFHGLAEALEGHVPSSSAAFHQWLHGAEEDDGDVSVFIGLPEDLAHPLYWGYPAYGIGPQGEGVAVTLGADERHATLRSMIGSYAGSGGNDAARFSIIQAMSLALALGAEGSQIAEDLAVLEACAAANPDLAFVGVAVDALKVKSGALPPWRAHAFWQRNIALFGEKASRGGGNQVLFSGTAVGDASSIEEEVERLTSGNLDDVTRFFNAAITEVSRRSHISSFWGDRLLTLDKAAGFLDEPSFAAAFAAFAKDHPYDQYMGSGSIAWRMHTLVWAARMGLAIKGDFVECGTFRGDMAAFICACCDLPAHGKAFHLFDSFEGFSPALSTEDDYPDNPGFLAYSNQFYRKEGLYEGVVERFSDMPFVRVHKGFLPEALEGVTPDAISFLHVDLNSWQAETACLEVLYDRVSPGGVIIYDDYGWKLFAKQREAADDFMAARGNLVLELPTGQGLVIKR